VSAARRPASSAGDERLPAPKIRVPSDTDGATMRSMRLVDSPEQHFTEGEPDIEPPEELAISELDDVALLEEELDNEDVLEQDVEEDVLEETLEDLVHHDDGDEEVDEEPEAPVGLVVPSPGEGDLEADDDLERDDDLEEGLDLVLEHRLALVEQPAAEEAGDDELAGTSRRPAPRAEAAEEDVRPCGPDEFTCRSCFLVHSRGLLADERAMVCRDCSA